MLISAAQLHATIDSLIAQAKRLAPRFAEQAANCGGDVEVRPFGPRQERALRLVCLAYAINYVVGDATWTDDVNVEASDLVDAGYGVTQAEAQRFIVGSLA